MEEVLETACSRAEGGQEEGAVGDALGPRGGHSNGVMGWNTGDDFASIRKGLGNDGIGNCGGLLLVCSADPGKDDNLLDRTTVLLIDPHDVEKPIDGDKLGSGNARNPGIVDGHGEVVRLETPGETTDAYLGQYAHLAGDLGF